MVDPLWVAPLDKQVIYLLLFCNICFSGGHYEPVRRSAFTAGHQEIISAINGLSCCQLKERNTPSVPGPWDVSISALATARWAGNDFLLLPSLAHWGVSLSVSCRWKKKKKEKQRVAPFLRSQWQGSDNSRAPKQQNRDSRRCCSVTIGVFFFPSVQLKTLPSQ